MTNEQEQQLREIRRARELGILPWSHLSNPTQRFDVATKTIDFLLSLADGQVASKSFAASHFQFGLCAHSMIKADCPSCCQSHAIRLEQQLGKLEASTVLPGRERIEKALREHMRHCYQAYKGVPPTIDDWVGGALHYVMWGLDRDIPLAPDSATSMRSACIEKVKEAGQWCDLCGHKNPPNEDGSCSKYGYNGVDCQSQPCVCRSHNPESQHFGKLITTLESVTIQEQK